MANGICVYAESYNGELETVAAELVSAAKGLAETTKEKVQAIVLSDHAEELVKELDKLGVDEIYAVKADHDITLQDDAVSAAIAEMLKKIEPSAVLVPATPQGRSIFSRVAMRLGCGMTADCTEVLAAQREDGSFYIKQNKPSYGENVFVTILTKEGIYPQMMTVRPGVYAACEAKESGNANVTFFDDIKIEKSGVEILEELPAENTTDSILGAEVVVVGGRGVLEDDNFELLEKFAEKVGGAIGGTRPMVDSVQSPDWTDRTYNPSEDLYLLWCIRSNSAYRRNQGYKFICCSQYRRKCCDFWSCRLRNPGRFKRNSGELPDTVI